MRLSPLRFYQFIKYDYKCVNCACDLNYVVSTIRVYMQVGNNFIRVCPSVSV